MDDSEQLLVLWAQLDDAQRAAVLACAKELAHCGPVACTVLERLAERLAMGARQYGDFKGERAWRREAVEEHLDGLVYLTIGLMEKG
jgi:hypothetical protein